MKKLSVVFIILAGFLWGTSGIFVHLLTPLGFSSLQMTAVRSVGSFLFILLYALIFNRRIFKVSLAQFFLFSLVGLLLYGTASLYYMGLILTSISTATVLMYMAPAYVMCYSVIFLGEKLSPLKIIALIAMISGCFFVAGIVGGIKFDLWGIILSILSGVSYAIYNIVVKIAMKKNYDPFSLTLYGFMFMALFSLLPAAPEGIVNIIISSPPTALVPVLLVGLVSCVSPYFLYTLSMKNLPAGTASAFAIVEPMAATIYSVLFFEEELSLFSIIGIVLICSAVFMLSRAKESTSDK